MHRKNSRETLENTLRGALFLGLFAQNSRETLENTLRGALFLGLFALAATALVAATYQLTRERIAENERLAILRGLHEIISPTPSPSTGPARAANRWR